MADERCVPHVEVELGEDDLGEGVLHGATATAVEGLGIAEQLQGGQEERRPGVELGGGVGQLAVNLCPLSGDGPELLLDLGFGSAWLADQVEVVLFFGVQLTQAGGEPLLDAN